LAYFGHLTLSAKEASMGEAESLGKALAWVHTLSPEEADMTDIAKEITELAELTTPKLRERWRRIYRGEPPAGISRDLLIRASTYQIQEEEHGGLSGTVKRRLRALAQKMGRGGSSTFDLAPYLKPGAKLIREWRGRTYSVIALEDGFDFEGRRYPSLSKIAREITGVRWSGPRFFGLTGGGKPIANSAEAPHE
jgi:hypothetical protein